MSLEQLEQIVLSNFPLGGVQIAFGYGSKVVKQDGRQTSSDLIDFIIAVDSPDQWHAANFKINSHHYSFIRYLPDKINSIVKIQENYGARVYFNPYVQLGSVSVKYGVVNTKHLISDLRNWDNLYVAGRLHKPVEFVINTCDKNDVLKSALRLNKESAIRASLLQLPETFDSLTFYKTIAGLSYHGDLRMLFGEDKNKIANIVQSQMDRFDQLYPPIIKFNSDLKGVVQWNENKRIFVQDKSPKTCLNMLKALPRDIRRNIYQSHSNVARTIDSDMVLTSVSNSVNCDRIVAAAIASVVRRSSLTQSFKGLFTAGLLKSLKYSQRKLAKSLASRLNLN